MKKDSILKMKSLIMRINGLKHNLNQGFKLLKIQDNNLRFQDIYNMNQAIQVLPQ